MKFVPLQASKQALAQGGFSWPEQASAAPVCGGSSICETAIILECAVEAASPLAQPRLAGRRSTDILIIVTRASWDQPSRSRPARTQEVSIMGEQLHQQHLCVRATLREPLGGECWAWRCCWIVLSDVLHAVPVIMSFVEFR